MNLQKIVKILPMLDSPVDAEALSALRILQRALLPETCGDIARLIEAQGFGPPVEAPEAQAKRPFTGFASAKARVKPTQPGPDWVWDEAAWAWKQRVKPPRPMGEGWIWHTSAWSWQRTTKPLGSRFETFTWNQAAEQWTAKIDYAVAMAAAMEVMNFKLARADKKEMEQIFVDAMAEKSISTYSLQRLEALERAGPAINSISNRYQRRYGTNV